MIRVQRQPARQATLDDRMVPLINVIFLLLLYFLLAGSLTELIDEDVQPPFSSQIDPLLERDGEWQLAADGRLTLPTGASIPAERLELALAQGQIAVPKTLRLQADHRVRANVLLTVIEQAQEAGAVTLSLVAIGNATPAGP